MNPKTNKNMVRHTHTYTMITFTGACTLPGGNLCLMTHGMTFINTPVMTPCKKIKCSTSSWLKRRRVQELLSFRAGERRAGGLKNGEPQSKELENGEPESRELESAESWTVES